MGTATVLASRTSNAQQGSSPAAGGAALAAMCLLASGVASAQTDYSAVQTPDIIIGPLLEELSSEPTPSIRLAQMEGEEGWRITDANLTPDAAFIARNALVSMAPGDVRLGLGVFSAPQTVIGRTSSGGYLTVSVLDNERPNWITAALSPEGVDMPAFLFSADRERSRSVALRYEGRFDSFGGTDGLDVGVIPRAGVSLGDRGSATEFGATVRLGQYLDQGEDARTGWWFFAGADRQAVIYEPGQRFDLRSVLTLQPYAMVGDAQAGIAMRVYGADLSFAYVRRETNWSMPTQSWEEVEDFAAFSLTIRR